MLSERYASTAKSSLSIVLIPFGFQFEKDFRAQIAQTNQNEIASEKLQKLIRNFDDFERIKYGRFLATGTRIVNSALKSNILKLECISIDSINETAIQIQRPIRKPKAWNMMAAAE